MVFRSDDSRRFTDDTYAGKEEVQAFYNVQDVSPLWQKILSYRSLFNEETDLLDEEGNHYQICLTKAILAKSYQLQRNLRNDKILLSSFSDSLVRQFILSAKKNALLLTAKKNGTKVTNATLDRIVEGTRESISSSLFLIKAYADAFDQGLLLTSSNLETLQHINNVLLGREENAVPSYRTGEEKDPYNTLAIWPKEKIVNALGNLSGFLSQDSIPVILRALGILYYFFSVRPFEYFNEETSSLFSKAFLSSSGLGIIGYALDFESVSFSKDFQRRKACESSLDLTYFLLPALNYRCHISAINHELLLKIKEQEPVSDTNHNISDSPDIPVEGSSVHEQALPFFPTNVASQEEVLATATKLRRIYPYLTKKQAHFYAGHCTIGLHYTIEQFKKTEDTVYETARKSREALASRGLYKKELIGKKFAYTPIPIEGKQNDD